MDFLGRARQRWMIAMGLLPSVALGWTGDGPSPGTGGYVVDTSNRNDVVSFWQHVYKASEDYGSHAVGSAAFVDDVERRVNFVRALCGVPADVQFNTGATVYILSDDLYRGDTVPILPPSTTKATASQEAADMIKQTYQSGIDQALSHNPPSNWLGWTTGAWNAASKGNLAFGFYGPGAVDSYFNEDAQGLDGGNTTVGHRRWLLNPKSTDFATGDYAGTTHMLAGGVPNAVLHRAVYPINCLYVFPKPEELDPSVSARFVPYPNAGFFPAPLNTSFWSLSYPGMTFTPNTSVQMWDANNTPLAGVDKQADKEGFGDNTLVWKVPAAASVKAVGADTRFTVKVSHFFLPGNPTAQDFTYTVTLINPDNLADPLTLTGPSSPIVQASTSYTFMPPAYSEEVEVGFFKTMAGTITENAEISPTPQIIDRTSSAPLYSVVPNFIRGLRTFRLTFANRYDPLIGGVRDQMFELDRDIVPNAGASMTFYYKRGYMATTSQLLIESSSDGGLVWTPLRAPIQGDSGSAPDPGAEFQAVVVPLPTSGILRIRFRLHTTDGAVISHEEYPTQPTGIFLDDISVTNCSQLEEKNSVSLSDSGNSVTFNSTTVGQILVKNETWWLRARVRMADRWFPYGTPKIVTTVGAFLPRGAAEPPVDGATYLFTPLDTPTSYTLEVAKPADTTLESAEAILPPVEDGTGGYSLISTKYSKTGSKSFRLSVDAKSDPLDTFTLSRSFEPTAGSNLTFYSQRRRMSETNYLDAEISNDDGLTWSVLDRQAGLGTNAGTVDSTMLFQTYSLADYAGQNIRIRFAFKNADGTAQFSADSGVAARTDSGVWIDDIVVTNVWTSVQQTSLPGTANSFRLDATTAGGPLVVGDSYRLRVREMAGVVPREWGDPLVVVPTATPATGYDAWVAYDYPTLQNVPFDFDSDGDGIPNGIEYAFWLDPLSRNSLSATSSLSMENEVLKITRPLPSARAGVIYGAEASDDLEIWSDAGVTVMLIDGQAVASIPVTAGSRFLRWKITKP